MAKVKCKVCGEEIEEDIPKCPRCDSLGPKKGKKIKLILLAITIVIVIGFIAAYISRSNEVEKPYAEVLKERHDEKLQRRAVTAALLLRTRIENPDSMKLDTVQTNEDGSILCFQYNEKDKQGKSKKSKAYFVDGELDQSDAGWKLFCSGKTMRPVKLDSVAGN